MWDKTKAEPLRLLYENDQAANTLFKWAVERQNDASQTPIDRLEQMGIDRKKAIELARELERLGYAKFVMGRRGSRSRIEWKRSLKSIGRAAIGDAPTADSGAAELHDMSAEMTGTPTDHGAVLPVEPLSIAEAKRRLAASLGVAPEAIEITVRA